MEDFDQFWPAFSTAFSEEGFSQLKAVLLGILPITLFYFLYDLIVLKHTTKQRLSIAIGLLYSCAGLWLFLTFANIGFLPVAQKVGFGLGAKSALFPIAVLLGGLFGVFGVLAEPAVAVLVKQIEQVSEGTIKAKSILWVMALSVGGGMALQIVRAYLGFSLLYYFIPIYALAIGLSFFAPTIYANIAFDSGSIASEPMAASFVLPFVIGFTVSSQGESAVFISAFGTIAMISAMPLVVIQLLGVYAETKRRIERKRVQKAFVEENDCQVIHFDGSLTS
jgi:hypothetical protein